MTTTIDNLKTAGRLQAPMEMLGAHAGVNIIDPSTVLTRLWYFDGKFLRASGFRLDQEYVRSLVGLTNQANGHGVVHGFDASKGNGDVIAVDGGLAIAPSGRVVYLPQDVQLSISQLIARSTGNFDPGVATTHGTAHFSACPPDQPAGPDEVLSSGDLFVLTVSAAEALCGEEERFGQLCEDACSTETDRSVAVEGVCFRVHELQLSLPTSGQVPFTGKHVRSQAASAYFEAERSAIASMISGAGLRSGVWCAGADGVAGEEVALGVFNRTGSITSWVDMWAARRELIETSPQRYWGWRFAMRPLDVFLAQVLQFQCQLLAFGADGPAPGDDPCVEEREALQAANQVLSTLLEGPASEEAVVSDLRAADVDIDSAALNASNTFAFTAKTQLAELSRLITDTLTGKQPSTTGSVAIDRGLVELPSGGYLPLDRKQDVQAQVRAFMGPGVDLRFCAVRPDFIPEALQEAQHMERISLTQGIDNPDNLEEVDVLVPGGTVERTEVETHEFEGVIRLMPDGFGENEPLLELQTLARERIGPGWSWTAVGTAALGSDVAFDKLINVAEDRMRPPGEERAFEIDELEALRSALSEESRYRDLIRRTLARRRRTARANPMSTLRNARSGDLHANPARADRVASLWIDIEVDRELHTLNIGDQSESRGRLIAFADAEDDALADIRFTGTLVVKTREALPVPGGFGVRLTTVVDGFLEGIIDRPNQEDSPRTMPTSGLELDWVVAVDATGKTSVAVAGGVDEDDETSDSPAIVLKLSENGSPRVIDGDLVLHRPKGPDLPPVTLADTDLTETPGALAIGSFGREVGETVIDVLGTELGRRGRDNGFAASAPFRLFGEDQGNEAGTIRTDADWVMFHRRRTKVCVDDQPTVTISVRRYRWWHADLDREEDRELLQELRGASGSLEPSAVAKVFDQLDLRLISTVEFDEGRTALKSSPVALRTDWMTRTSSKELALAVVGDSPSGDGTIVGLGRLLAATSAVSPLIDTTDVQTDVLNGIPADFQASGIDGVFLSLGLSDPRERLHRCARIYHISRGALDGLTDVDSPVSMDTIDDIVSEVDGKAEFAVANFENQELVNIDELVEFVSGRPIDLAHIGFADPGDQAEQTVWLGRGGNLAGVISEAVGSPSPTGFGEATWNVDGCQAVIFLVGPQDARED